MLFFRCYHYCIGIKQVFQCSVFSCRIIKPNSPNVRSQTLQERTANVSVLLKKPTCTNQVELYKCLIVAREKKNLMIIAAKTLFSFSLLFSWRFLTPFRGGRVQQISFESANPWPRAREFAEKRAGKLLG